MTTAPRTKQRRKLITDVEVDRRKAHADRRKCPDCKGTVLEKISMATGGAWVTSFCTRCPWKSVSKRINRDEAVRLLTCTSALSIGALGVHVTLPLAVATLGKIKASSKLTYKPIFRPGVEHGTLWELEIS